MTSTVILHKTACADN